MVAIGSHWTVAADEFAAIEIYGSQPADHIEQRAILVVLDPARLPAHGLAKGALLTVVAVEHSRGQGRAGPRVAFRNAADSRQYWTDERAFQKACEPRR
jgi:hypothetical protein